MTFKKAVLGLTLAAFAALPALSAKAQGLMEPELYFYPAKGWNVKSAPIQNAATANKSCNILTEFNNGFRLQFTGEAGDIKTVALDFRQTIFQTGDQHNAIMVVPGIAQISAPARANSGSLIVADLSQKNGFLNALRNASVLDFYLGENRFRFYLTAFNAAVGKFDECTSAMKGNHVVSSSKRVDTAAIEQPVSLSKPLEEENHINAVLEAARKNVEKEAQTAAISKPVKLSETSAEPIKLAKRQPIEESGPVISRAEDVPPPPFWEGNSSVRSQENSTVAADLDNNDFPDEIRGQRYTELLAQQMNALEENTVSPASPPSAVKVKAPVSENVAEEEVVIEEVIEEPEIKQSEISWNEPPVSQPVQEAFVQPEIKAVKKQPREIISRTQISSPPSESRQTKGRMEADFTAAYNKKEQELAAMAAKQERDNELIRELMAKINALEENVSTLREENTMLDSGANTQMSSPTGNDGILIASDNWNLERATMRFNEAERQLKRLGRELQKERARCETEKEELEAMLFDPQLTSQTQIAKLADLEEQLADAKAELSLQRMRYEERIRLLEKQPLAN